MHVSQAFLESNTLSSNYSLSLYKVICIPSQTAFPMPCHVIICNCHALQDQLSGNHTPTCSLQAPFSKKVYSHRQKLRQTAGLTHTNIFESLFILTVTDTSIHTHIHTRYTHTCKLKICIFHLLTLNCIHP